MNSVVLDGGAIARADVIAVAQRQTSVTLGDVARQRMLAARAVVEEAVTGDDVVYGVTTGFGALASTHIGQDEVDELQHRLVRSHAAAVGEPLADEIVRAMLVLRARTLSQGHSGVRPVVVERLLHLLEHDILPVVPSHGSVGASGDLAQFAHLALPLIGEGLVSVHGEIEPATTALADAGVEPLTLAAKEGLSLLNGTEGMLAIGIIALNQAETLVAAADGACALSVEALLGSSIPFQARIHDLRPHPGQSESARRIRSLLAGSGIVESHAADFDHAVQDAYSLRCAPQVHGAVRDVIGYATAVFDREAGAVVDNPIVFADSGDVVSGGNFHGQPLAFALDFLAIAVAELGSISERRTDRLLDPSRSSGLTPFLASKPGVDSGYMLSQYTAAALVAENRILAHPASVDSIPTSGLQEDHVSMGFGAATKLLRVLKSVSQVLAVEFMCAAQGVDQRAPLRPAAGTAALHATIRSRVPRLDHDRPIGGDIVAIAEQIRNGDLA
ncbi:MAG: histidine ammonia-lyase [bacterium]|nr:histidine ammonia-lyase [bacterium]